MLSYMELGAAEARIAIDACAEELVRRGKAGTIAVGDRHGELIALLRMDGAALPTVVVATNKAFTAARDRRPSGDVGRASKASGWDLCNFGDPRYIGWEGGAPVIHQGQIVGAVAVSGLTGVEDLEIAEIGIAAILRQIES